MSSIFKSVLGIFSEPDVPTYTPPEIEPVKVPTQDNSAAELAAAKEAEAKKRATQKGRAATILSGSSGILGDDAGGIATKKLLGK